MTAVSQWITTTLSLRCEEEVNLLYIVEIEEGNNVYHCYSTENYYQALLVAKRVFNRLRTKEGLGDFGVMIASPQGRGGSYDVNTFTYDPDFNDSSKFYSELAHDLEYEQVMSGTDLNTLFRKAVGHHKLNEYQEQKLLQYLKELRSEKSI